MRKTLEVVDDFYSNPMAYREQALKSAVFAQRGKESDIRCGSNDLLEDDESVQNAFRILELNPSVSQVKVCGYLILRDEGPHERLASQLGRFEWVGFVCLSVLDRCSGSIWFYRRTQFASRVPESEAISGGPVGLIVDQSHAVADPEYLRQATVYETSVQLPMRFNRMILFRASLLGCGVSPGFEKTSESGLLVQVLAVS